MNLKLLIIFFFFAIIFGCKSECKNCDGTGEKPCFECYGNGIVECEDCNGEGYTQEFVGCSRPASDCCGGCYASVSCECENRFYPL